MKRVSQQEAYCLHRRPYRETSFLVDVLTVDHGRFTVIARAARAVKNSSQGLLQPFTPLLISWAGHGELVTLTQVELHGEVKQLQGEALYAGFYLNELLMRLLQPWDPYPQVYSMYAETLSALCESGLQSKILRLFEKSLLEELGYGLIELKSMTEDCWNNEDKLQEAKRLMRQALAQLLGKHPLQSRKLFS